MADKTLTRMDLNEAVFREVGLSRNESADLVESILNHISEAMLKGEQVKKSSFGTFKVMNILILGAGRVGSASAVELASEQDNEVTVVDIDGERLEKLSSKWDLRVIEGNASHPNILKSAGGETADMIIAVSSSDEVNMISCQIASTLFSVPIKIARVRSQAYNMEEWKHLFNEGLFSIDALISPEQEVAKSFTRLVAVPGAKDLISFDEDEKTYLLTKFLKLYSNFVF